jgi:hypothetical protein
VEESFLSAIECTVHGVNDVRETEVHTAQPLVPEPSASEVQVAIEKLKRHKSPVDDQIPEKAIKQDVGQFVLRPIKLLIVFTVPVYTTAVVIESCHSYQVNTKCSPAYLCQV